MENNIAKDNSNADLKSLPMPELLKKLGSSIDGLTGEDAKKTVNSIWSK